jgi:hypothetical protein
VRWRPDFAIISCKQPTGELAIAQVTVNATSNPLCDPQQTPQADDAREEFFQRFLVGSVFCENATLNLFSGQVTHTFPTVAPRPTVMDHTSFNIAGGTGTVFIDNGSINDLNQNFPCGTHANGRTLCAQPDPSRSLSAGSA